MGKHITILGAGVMGSAMCLPAADKGHTVRLVGTHLDREIIDSVKASARTGPAVVRQRSQRAR